MKRIIFAIIAMLISVSVSSAVDTLQTSKSFTKIINSSLFVSIYQIIPEVNNSLYTSSLVVLPDESSEFRNIVPPVFNINAGNNTQILIDSCDFDMIYYSKDSVANESKYLTEFINPNTNKVIAFEYGAAEENHRYQLDSVPYQFKSLNSYFLTIADADQYASQYLPNEVTEIFAFSDSNNNTLFEIKYQDKIVGIKYYSAKNNQWFTKYFKPKV